MTRIGRRVLVRRDVLLDIRVVLPDKDRTLRRKAPVASKSAAQRWGEERERLWYHALTNPQLVEVKKEVPTLQELAGHQDLATTQRYMHLSPAALDSAIQLLERSPSGRNFGDMLETAGREIEKVNG